MTRLSSRNTGGRGRHWRLALIPAAALAAGGLLWASTGTAPDGGMTERGAPSAPSFDAALGARASEQRPASTIDYARLDRRLQLLMEKDVMVGLSVAIVEDGEIRFLKGYGETIAGSGDPVTPNTVFRWASLSKGVAGNMVALLAADDALSLDAPVADYAASLRLPAGGEHKASIADVLSHQLGLFAHAHDARLEDGDDARRLRGSLAALDPICPVSQCHAYQNVAFDAAAEAVERATGKPYHQVVYERMFGPLGMTSASLSREGLYRSPSWARPHRGGRNSRPVEVTDSYYRVPAAGGVNSSIKDLALWLRAQMGADPRILPPAVLAAAHAPRVATPGENARRRKYRDRISGAAYGLGWRVFDYAGHKVVGHRGGVTGYRSLILFDPVRRTGVAALWNSGTGQPGGLEYEVMDMVYGLPFRDWLELSDSDPDGPVDPVEAIGVLSEAGGTAH